MKVTFKAVDVPGHSGWQGYTHNVEVFLNGEKIGELIGSGHNKSKLEYGLRSGHFVAGFYPKLFTVTGLRAAKEAVKKAVAKAYAKDEPVLAEGPTSRVRDPDGCDPQDCAGR